jgi:hypothetical protein
MGVDQILNSQDYGQRVKVCTWCSDITVSETQWTRWRNEATGETKILTATYTEDTEKLAKYPVVTVIPPRWLKDKLGLWLVTAEVRWSDAVINGDTITVLVQRSPTVTTTTTSTTSTTSTTTTTAP